MPQVCNLHVGEGLSPALSDGGGNDGAVHVHFGAHNTQALRAAEVPAPRVWEEIAEVQELADVAVSAVHTGIPLGMPTTAAPYMVAFTSFTRGNEGQAHLV